MFSNENSEHHDVKIEVPESPFVDFEAFQYEPPQQESPTLPGNNSFETESPFLNSYESFQEDEGASAEEEAFVDIVSELWDEEFNDALAELAAEAANIHEEQFINAYPGTSFQNENTNYIMNEHFMPLASRIENLLEQLAEEFSKNDIYKMSDEEIDLLFEKYEHEHFASPYFENFFGKVWKKIKKVAGKVGKVLKKISPLHIVLRKLKKFIRPFLKRILKVALNKIPAKFRPLAKKIAGHFIKEAGEDYYTLSEEPEPASFSIPELQAEFDFMTATLLLETNSDSQEYLLNHYLNEDENETVDVLDKLYEARERFIREFSALQEGEDPVPVIENFIPAILMAVKWGVKLIGRKRVVNLLSKLVAKLIGRFVGKRNALPLAKAVVGVGMKVIGLEVSPETEDEMRIAAEVIADTIEETVELATQLPEHILDNELLVNNYLAEAFETAAGENFPTVLMKNDFQEERYHENLWNRKRYYYKYKQIIDIELSPAMARQVKSFGGKTLYQFIREELKLKFDKNLKARMHIYKARRSTWLSRISLGEKKVAGLGTAKKSAWSQLHPLTKKASTALLKSPAFAGKRDIPPKYLATRHLITTGQRFYYLEIDGSKNVIAPKNPARTSELNLAVNFIKNFIQVDLFLSEKDAQQIAAVLRGQQSISTAVKIVIELYKKGLKAVLFNRVSSHVKLIHETAYFEQAAPGLFLGLVKIVGSKILDKLLDRLVEWLLAYLEKWLLSKRNEFTGAVENSADGVTLSITFSNVKGLTVLRKILKRRELPGINAASLFLPGAIPGIDIKIRPGFYRV